MSDIYTLFRKFIGDDVTDYSMPDLAVLKFLDLGIDKLAAVTGNRYIEDLVITTADITAGYKDLTKNCLTIVYTELPDQNRYWQFTSPNRITFLDKDYITAGTYRFEYTYEYKKFDGSLRDNSYFDYPRRADMGIIFWALAEYQVLNGIVNVDGGRNAVISKSEEGMSISYSSSETMSMSSPETLKAKAMEIFRSLNTVTNSIFAVTI